MPKAHFEVAPAEKGRELAIAVPEVQDHSDRLVLLCMRDEEVQQKTLAAPRRTENQRVADVLDVKIESVWRMVRRLEDGQSLSLQMGIHRLTLINVEHEAQICRVGLEQRQAPEVVGAISRNDAQPGVQQVVGLIEDGAIMNGDCLGRFGGLLLEDSSFGTMQHQRQRAVTEEVAVDLGLRQRVTELPDRRARRIVNQHLFGLRFGRDIVHERDALVEEMAPAALQVSTHPFCGNALPLQAANEVARNLV
jgi:hypothetical protein